MHAVYHPPFGNSWIGERLSFGLRCFLMTSNPGPSLLLTGGVDACSYSDTRFTAGGEGVDGGDGLNLRTVRDLSADSCNDRAKASSRASRSSGESDGPAPPSSRAGDTGTGGS